MSPRTKGVFLGAAHLGLALLLAASYEVDRVRLPRVWVEVEPAVRAQAIRGRYLRLALKVDLEPGSVWRDSQTVGVRLSVRNSRLVAEPDSTPFRHWVRVSPGGKSGTLVEPLAYFLPESQAVGTVFAPGEVLMVEVSVPGRGVPRPIRLGSRRGGVTAPLSMEMQPRLN